jgi:hypothetical protein
MLLLASCAHVKVLKLDGTIVDAFVFGSTKLSDMNYDRTEEGIHLSIGEFNNTPEGIAEIIEKLDNLALNMMTLGATGTFQTLVHPEN